MAMGRRRQAWLLAACCCQLGLALVAAKPSGCEPSCLDATVEPVEPSAWRLGGVSIGTIAGCADSDDATPCFTVDELRNALHNKVVSVQVLNATALVDGPTLSPALANQTLDLFVCAFHSCALDSSGAALAADVAALVSGMDHCPLAGDNVLALQVQVVGEALVEGAPALPTNDTFSGAVLDVTVAHEAVLEFRNQTQDLVVVLANTLTTAGDPGATTCVA